MSQLVYSQQQLDQDNAILSQINNTIVQVQKSHSIYQYVSSTDYFQIFNDQQIQYLNYFLSPTSTNNIEYSYFRNTILNDFKLLLNQTNTQISLTFSSKYQINEDVTQIGIPLNTMYMCQFYNQTKSYYFFLTQFTNSSNSIINVFYVYDVDYLPDQFSLNTISINTHSIDSLITNFLNSPQFNTNNTYDIPSLIQQSQLETTKQIFSDLLNNTNSCQDFECQKIKTSFLYLFCIYVVLFARENFEIRQQSTQLNIMTDILQYYFNLLKSLQVQLNLFDENFTQQTPNGITVFNPDFVQERLALKQNTYNNWLNYYFLVISVNAVLTFSLIIISLISIFTSTLSQHTYNISTSVICFIVIIFIFLNIVFNYNQ